MNERGTSMPEMRYAMVVDLRRCIGCHSCSVVCKSENDVPLGVWRTWIKEFEKGTFPHVRKAFVPLLCNNCDDPPCVPVCPVGATSKRDDGIVIINPHLCIGCRYCMAACPYGMRHLHPVLNVVEKCHWCVHRVAAGLRPACVDACPTGALSFGDLRDRDDPLSRMLVDNPVQTLRPELGTSPHVFYIGLDVRLVEDG